MRTFLLSVQLYDFTISRDLTYRVDVMLCLACLPGSRGERVFREKLSTRAEKDRGERVKEIAVSVASLPPPLSRFSTLFLANNEPNRNLNQHLISPLSSLPRKTKRPPRA